jgi:hypothetical protein
LSPPAPRFIFQEEVMTAAVHDDAVTTSAAPRVAPAPKQASKRLHRPLIDVGGDPLLDASARLLAIPLRHMYAALWRVGLVEVR